MKKFLRRFLFSVLPLAYMALIWFLSSRPSDAVFNTGLPYDRTIKESLHLVEFGILYVMWVLFFNVRGSFSVRLNNLAAFLAIFYGLADEAHQFFVPSRSASLIDLLKDAIGVAVGWYLIHRACFQPARISPGLFLWIREKLSVLAD